MKSITIKDLTKSYGKRVIFSHLNFSVDSGEFIAIIGPSGSGKSTLLNILGMLEEKTGGDVMIDNKSLPKINSHSAVMMRRNKINYLFQSFALISDATVFDNLLLAMNFMKISKKEKAEKIAATLTDLDISFLKSEKISTLSGGEKQRVALARTILKPGNIVLADEPTGALDPEHAKIAFQQIKDLRDKYGKTIIMVTHNMEEAAQADKIIDLKRI